MYCTPRWFTYTSQTYRRASGTISFYDRPSLFDMCYTCLAELSREARGRLRGLMRSLLSREKQRTNRFPQIIYISPICQCRGTVYSPSFASLLLSDYYCLTFVIITYSFICVCATFFFTVVSRRAEISRERNLCQREKCMRICYFELHNRRRLINPSCLTFAILTILE